MFVCSILLAYVAGLGDSRTVLCGMLGAMCASWIAFAFAARTSSAGESLALKTILVWGVLFRLPAFFTQPILEDDHFRFIWDGLRLLSGSNPYESAPADWFTREGLTGRDGWILSNINHPDLPTIYGPTAQLLFAASQWFAPGELTALRAFIIGADLLSAIFVARLAGTRAALLFLWCPLLIKKGAFNAHYESVAIALCLGAQVLILKSRRGWISIIMLAVATAMRPFAILFLPLTTARQSIAGAARFAVIFVVCLVALYLPFGSGALGSTGAFGRGWEFNSSIFALTKLSFGDGAARFISLALMVAIVLAVGLRARATRPSGGSRDWALCGMILYGALFLLSPVANAWYSLWLLPFAVMRAGTIAACAWTLLIAVSLSYITSNTLGGDAGELHPWWVRIGEYGAVACAAICGVTINARRNSARQLDGKC
jgi:hypothetical protein